jgi:hypothetical protein
MLMTEPDFQPFFTAMKEIEAVLRREMPICENSLQFLCMRWAAGSRECRQQGLCELRDASE